MKNDFDFIIFTDGSSKGNPGPGGWAAIVHELENMRIEEIGGGEKKTTNNRMEITAALEALKSIPKGKKVSVVTDSTYLSKGASLWVYGWIKNDWKTKTGDAVLNRDLWQKLFDELSRVNVKWTVVAGHAGHGANERCDEIATAFAGGEKVNLFKGKESDYKIDLNKKAEAKSKAGKAYSYVSALGNSVAIHNTWAECEKRVKGKAGARFKKVFSKDEEADLVEKWRNS